MQFSLHCCCCLPPIVVLCAAQITATASALVVVVALFIVVVLVVALVRLALPFCMTRQFVYLFLTMPPPPFPFLHPSISLSRLKTYKKLPIPFCSPTSHSHYVSVRHTKHKNVASATKQFIFEAYAGYASPSPPLSLFSCSRSLSYTLADIQWSGILF